MLPKTPKERKFSLWGFAKGSVKTIIAVEVACFVASFGIYHRMNTNRVWKSVVKRDDAIKREFAAEENNCEKRQELLRIDFRLYINENFPFMLDYYYKLGEVIGNSEIRQIDADIWSKQKKRD